MGKFYRINQYIQAKQVRVVDEAGKQIGVMDIFAAIQKARERGVDLVEVSPKADPPVCKVINFKKFKYLEAKKEKEERKGQRGGELKEIQLSPFIAPNDLDFRLKRIKEFITEGNKVKVRVRFTGRQMTKREFGLKVLATVSQNLEGTATAESEPKMVGRELTVIYSSDKRK